VSAGDPIPVPAPPLVTIDEAAWQVAEVLSASLPQADRDALERAIVVASGDVLDYLSDRADPAWTPDTVPEPIKHATLLVVGFYWRNRGDDLGDKGRPADALEAALGNLLMRRRDPVVR